MISRTYFVVVTIFSLIALIGCDDVTRTLEEPSSFPRDTCEGADFIFEFPDVHPVMYVVGEGCSSGPTVQSATIFLEQSGRFAVNGFIGRSGAQESNEDFRLVVLDEWGPETQDSNPPGPSETYEFLGKFDFQAGENVVTMRTVAACPPDVGSNSVRLAKICLFRLIE